MSSASNITRLEDARALKAMNLPLNMPVEKRKFSLEYSNHWVDLMNAHTDFMNAVGEYIQGPRAGTQGKWKLIRRRLTALDHAADQCVAFLAKLGSDVVPPVFKAEQDEHEHAILGSFLTERAGPFIQWWGEAIDAVNAGAELTFKPGDVPPWVGSTSRGT